MAKAKLTTREQVVAQVLWKHSDGITDKEIFEDLQIETINRNLFPSIQIVKDTLKSLKKKGFLKRTVVNRMQIPHNY